MIIDQVKYKELTLTQQDALFKLGKQSLLQSGGIATRPLGIRTNTLRALADRELIGHYPGEGPYPTRYAYLTDKGKELYNKLSTKTT